MTLTLLTEHHLEFLSIKGGCTGWKSHVEAHLFVFSDTRDDGEMNLRFLRPTAVEDVFIWPARDISWNPVTDIIK